MATYTMGRVGIEAKGTYSASTSYSPLDMVCYQGSSYIAKAPATGILPTNASHWMQASEDAYSAAVSAGYTDSQSQFYLDLAAIRTLASELAAI